MIIGVIGLGFVGSALHKSFQNFSIQSVVYDKYKSGGIGKIEDTLKADIIFLCLPTLYNQEQTSYDITSIIETLDVLSKKKYSGLIVLKSTVEVETTLHLSKKYQNLKICHNPEFLSAKTAYQDFHNQSHIVIGKGVNCDTNDMDTLMSFYKKHYPKAEISLCLSNESECMKLMCNSFYASKVAIFNEFYLFSQKLGIQYDTIRSLMIKNNWINPQHTLVPGTDSQLGFGGACLPKDTQALANQLESHGCPNSILKSVLEENNIVRNSNLTS